MDTVRNAQIAQRLAEVAGILEVQGANPFRVGAYRRAAETVRELREPVSALLEREGLEGLRRLPGIGERLSVAIQDMVRTGRYPLLEHLRGEVDPVKLLQTAPGIGKVQAQRLHHDLGIDTLEELDAAAHDGRLESMAGFGSKRVAGIVDALEPRRSPKGHVPVEELLDVDREYREAVREGRLPKIAPRRFNPTHAAWLPILHTERGERHYTVLFSNTARAHQLGRTDDWVVIYQEDEGGAQNTVITSHQGPLRGKRIVRGRETECESYYLLDLK